MGFTDDFNDMDAQEEYNKKLQEEVDKMKAYRKAIEEEFAKIDVEDPASHKKVREKIHELVPAACEQVALMLEHSTSDAVRANLAKYVLTEASKSVTAETPGDVLNELFKALAKNDPESEEAVKDQ